MSKKQGVLAEGDGFDDKSVEVRVLFRALSVEVQRLPKLKSLGFFCGGDFT
jgi:hypothetical protein